LVSYYSLLWDLWQPHSPTFMLLFDFFRKVDEEVIGSLSGDGNLLRTAPREIKKQKQFVLAAVTSKGLALKHTIRKLCDDEEICFAAVTQDWRSLAYCSKRCREIPELAMIAVKQDWHALEWVPQKLRHNRDVLQLGIQQHGLALRYGAGDILKNKDLVFLAVTNNGMALQYAPLLQGDDEVVAMAIAQNRKAKKFASDEWKAKNIVGWTPKQKKDEHSKTASAGMKRSNAVEIKSLPQLNTNSEPASIDEDTAARIKAQLEWKMELKREKAKEDKARRKRRHLESSALVAEKVLADKKKQEEQEQQILEEKTKYAEELEKKRLNSILLS
jgi:hypothetical protein